jgi:hypothetical protein
MALLAGGQLRAVLLAIVAIAASCDAAAATVTAAAGTAPAAEGWTARMVPCLAASTEDGAVTSRNQSWAFSPAGELRNAEAAGQCATLPSQTSGCGAHCGRVHLTPCSSGGEPPPVTQRWALAAPPSRLVSGGGDDACLLIRENEDIDPTILYAVAPCKNTSNEQWQHSPSTGRLTSLCDSGTCAPWKGWCLTAERGPPPLPAPPPPPPPVPLAPLAAVEEYRTRVHTAGHYCCPSGQPFCNATGAMQHQRCSGYYDFGSPQLLLSKNGTLLSFNQGERKAHQDDNNWIDLVVTRSFDQGRSFGPLQVVHSENDWRTPASKYQSIGQNTAVLDAHTGWIHLLFARNDTLAFHTHSTDDGATWAKPAPVPKPGCASCWIAPSFSAIQLQHGPHAGDLVACLDYIETMAEMLPRSNVGPASRSGTLISSDGGKSWFVGATNVTGDECAVAELANGTVVLNARNYVGRPHVHRSIAWSMDGARSFSPVYFPETLPDPVVEGSMLFGEHTPAALGVGKPLFFTNPASERAREDITLKMSETGGASWTTVHLVQQGCGMYSSVVQFPDGTLGVQWDDAHGGPVSHAGLANETFVRLRLLKRQDAGMQ